MYCGEPIDGGWRCTRKVLGRQLRCWQHGGPKRPSMKERLAEMEAMWRAEREAADEMAALATELECSVSWHTTCGCVAGMLDGMYAETVAREMAQDSEAAMYAALRLAEQKISQTLAGQYPDGAALRAAMEAIASVRVPLDGSATMAAYEVARASLAREDLWASLMTPTLDEPTYRDTMRRIRAAEDEAMVAIAAYREAIS